MATDEAIVRLKGPDTKWQTLGHDTAVRGVVAEGLNLTANEQGPDTASFTLKRSPAYTWPDLRAFSFCEIEVGGAVVWGGRIWETPGQDAETRSMAVTGRGWQYHLDDDLLKPLYVHRDLGIWKDIRTHPDASLTSRHYADGDVRQTGGSIGIMWEVGNQVTAYNHVAIYLDTGITGTDQAGQAKRITVSGHTLNDHATFVLYARASDVIPWTGSGDVTDAIAGTSFTTLGRNYTSTATFSTTRRYVIIFVYWNSGTSSTVATNAQGGHGISFEKILLYGAAGWESGNESNLHAGDVFNNVLGSGALPLLDSSTSRVDTTTFAIPELHGLGGSMTPRQILQAANAYHDNLHGVDARRRLFFNARPSSATLEVGEWSGATFSDAGLSAQDIYNQVVVNYTGPDGNKAEETRTQTSGLLDKLGFDRTTRLNVQAAVTQAAASQIGDVFLAENSVPRFKGSIGLAGQGAVRTTAGPGIHPAHLLLRVGEILRLTDRSGEDGSWGRNGRIRAVTYNHTSKSAQVTLDNSRGRFDALLSRLAAVQGQIR